MIICGSDQMLIETGTEEVRQVLLSSLATPVYAKYYLCVPKHVLKMGHNSSIPLIVENGISNLQ